MEDVTVVGGGICGLSAAIALSKKGYSVKVISEITGIKTCGGGFTEKAIERYPWLMKKRKEFNGRVIKGVNWFYHNDRIKMETSGMLCVRRQDLDNFLKKVAESEGVKFQKAHIKDIKFGNKIYLFTTKGDKIPVKRVFDATGALGPLKKVKKDKFIGLQHVFEINEKTIDNKWGHKIYMFSDFHAIKGIGYSWIFPDKHHVKVGTGTFMGEDKKYPPLEQEINYLVEMHAPFLKNAKYRPEGAYVSSPTTSVDPAPVENYFVGGDGVGLVKELGEGNYYAMLSAEIFASTSFDREEYIKYIGKLQRFLQRQGFLIRVAFGTKLMWLVFKAVPLLHLEKLLHDLLRAPPFPKDKFRVLKNI
jgi:flavin-dependent dehydrogenase